MHTFCLSSASCCVNNLRWWYFCRVKLPGSKVHTVFDAVFSSYSSVPTSLTFLLYRMILCPNLMYVSLNSAFRAYSFTVDSEWQLCHQSVCQFSPIWCAEVCSPSRIRSRMLSGPLCSAGLLHLDQKLKADSIGVSTLCFNGRTPITGK